MAKVAGDGAARCTLVTRGRRRSPALGPLRVFSLLYDSSVALRVDPTGTVGLSPASGAGRGRLSRCSALQPGSVLGAPPPT